MEISYAKRVIIFLAAAVMTCGMSLTGCNCDEDEAAMMELLLLAGGGDPFRAAETPGESIPVTVGSETINMIYANDQSTITFPLLGNDSDSATIDYIFFISETETTNAAMAAVLNWAYGQGKFSETNSSVDGTTARFYSQILLDLGSGDCHVEYAGGVFSAEAGYDDHPVTEVSWYGAVMFCNWLTEMCDGNTGNLGHGSGQLRNGGLTQLDCFEKYVRIFAGLVRAFTVGVQCSCD